MKNGYFGFVFLLLSFFAPAQSIRQQLQKAVLRLQADPQLRHGIFSVFVVDGANGKTVFEKNKNLGLAPASCQKIVTSAAAMELLGKEFRYATRVQYTGAVSGKVLDGDLCIVGAGDPSLGSSRWQETTPEFILEQIIASLQHLGIEKINGNICIDNSAFSIQPIPGSWIWEDIGNYYGAGSWGINWKENQFDLILQSGSRKGDSVSMINMNPNQESSQWINQIRTGEKGTGDNGYIYLPPYGHFGFTQGTIPPNESHFVISGAVPNPPMAFARDLQEALHARHIQWAGNTRILTGGVEDAGMVPGTNEKHDLVRIISPPLDSLNYWFLKKSINLYGEALLKTLADERTGLGSTENGLDQLIDFWVKKGIDPGAIHILDGSGLSPQNRVSTDALVRVLQFAGKRSWFPSFFQALPEINGMRMKSGSIGGARSFAGYHHSRSGHDYIFAIIVNNYDGSPEEMVKKMKGILDLLKE